MTPLLLTGPAGSGKTFRCLAEIADRLRKSPEGPPLILLAPRQATYQLERQILSLPGIDGFTRLRILSFQRLAQYIFELTNQPEPKLLDEQGRVMVLRAILGCHRATLHAYGPSANRDGLAQEFSSLWRELCEHNIGPAALRAAAERVASNPRLHAKLTDFADVFADYVRWLEEHQLQDADALLDIAAEAASKGPLPHIEALWLDGFAQMTPQERRLLNAVLKSSGDATLAFCLPSRPLQESDGFSMWGVLSRTYCQLRAELQQIFNSQPREETLPRRAAQGRFDSAPMLAHLEKQWGNPSAFEAEHNSHQVRIVQCPNPEAEAIFTARKILKFVRAGGRFREAAVLVRSLDGSHDLLQRVFHRYGIPTFIDRREAVAHHPLAELTRGALRTIAFGFRQHELFCALKSGLTGLPQRDLDWFENLALSRGWHGQDWRGPLACGPKATDIDTQRADRIRKLALRPIHQLEKNLGHNPSGLELASALREFWSALNVENQLSDWAEQAHESLHNTVWTQMDAWLDSIELAFANERMTLPEWLGIVEAGLSSLTVGLIPPALDQTLIGAVDRSRNPDLKAVFLLGVNEGLFPKPGKERLLMNDAERLTLEEAGLRLGATSIWNLGAEQFYGYIACTRGRESLTITYSQTAPDGSPLNPSLFITHLQRLFPKLEIEQFTPPTWTEAEAAHELNSHIFEAARRDTISPLRDWPLLTETWTRAQITSATEDLKLPPDKVTALYGNRLRTSVSRLEQFAMCPFRFFISSGLRAEERLLYELDRREEGSFQHEILAAFHHRVAALNKRWRDITPAEGRALIAEISASMRKTFQEGLVEATAANRFKAEAKTAALQEFIASYLELMRDCDFDPHHVELAFGPNGPLPVWIVKIDDERALEFSGRIDRIDIWIDPQAQRCYVAVFDYKSSERKLDRRLVEEAIQQQLPAYLAALQSIAGSEQFPFPVSAAGAFYVNLRLKVKSAGKRKSDEDDAREDLKQFGVFDSAFLNHLDPKGTRQLFDYNIKSGKSGDGFKALPTEEFIKLLQETETRLRVRGQKIFDGDVRMDPYLHKKQTPCHHCFYMGICRIDPWTHEFRKL